MFQILVAEDDKELCDLFCTVLTDNGYTAVPAADGLAAFDILDDTYIDLVISDIMMPRMDGFELTKALRESGYSMPILIITAKESATDKREGFRLGTDDYMVKPIDVNEMVWRVEALLRRSQLVNQRKTKFGETEFDCDTLTISSHGKTTELPQKEFYLIMDDVWGPDSEADSHTLDVHISRLRERFKNNEDFEIVTVRGLGYKAVSRHG